MQAIRNLAVYISLSLALHMYSNMEADKRRKQLIAAHSKKYVICNFSFGIDYYRGCVNWLVRPSWFDAMKAYKSFI
jgi:hypothetical protein